MSQEQLEEAEGLSLVDIKMPGLSKEDNNRLEEQAFNFWERYKKYGKKHNAEKNWIDLKRHLRNAYGVEVYESRNEPRFYLRNRLNNDAEKARQNVAKYIKRAIKDIQNAIPPLGRHLEKHISTGAKCSYHPDLDDQIKWNIRL
jgi:hypothetical protein